MAFWSFLFPRWDMLIPWRVILMDGWWISFRFTDSEVTLSATEAVIHDVGHFGRTLANCGGLPGEKIHQHQCRYCTWNWSELWRTSLICVQHFFKVNPPRTNRFHVGSHDPVAVLYNVRTLQNSSSYRLRSPSRGDLRSIGDFWWGKIWRYFLGSKDQSPLENMHCTIGTDPQRNLELVEFGSPRNGNGSSQGQCQA